PTHLNSTATPLVFANSTTIGSSVRFSEPAQIENVLAAGPRGGSAVSLELRAFLSVSSPPQLGSTANAIAANACRLDRTVAERRMTRSFPPSSRRRARTLQSNRSVHERNRVALALSGRLDGAADRSPPSRLLQRAFTIHTRRAVDAALDA